MSGPPAEGAYKAVAAFRDYHFTMLIMVDQAIAGAAELFGRVGDVRRFDGRAVGARDLADADALVVRSVTRVDGALLAGSKVRFVGTATSGTDHVDQAYLDQQGIQFAVAGGCNARPVAEYVFAAILLLARRQGFDPGSRTLGVVGVGRIGSLVAAWAEALGMEVLPYDPPRSAALTADLNRAGREPGVLSGDILPPPPSPWVTKSDLLARSDIVSLHVPLVRDGPYPTREMVGAAWLAAMKAGSILINTARGEVVCEPAVIEARRSGRLAGLVADVWTGEPAINEALAERCDIATPHVAGYSREARRRAAALLYDALAEWAGVSTPTEPPGPTPPQHQFTTAKPIRAATVRERTAGASARPLSGGRGSDRAVLDALLAACPLSDIDAGLRSAIAEGALPERFDALRAAAQSRSEVLFL